MFFLVALFVVGLALSLFASPKPKITNATPGKLSDISFPRASEGAPIPRIYGTVKFQGPNTIWDGDFASVPITKRVSTGLFSHKNQTVGYKYYLGLDLAVCLGPNFTFRRIWAGNYELWNGCLSECENVINVNLPNLYGGNDKNGGFVGDIALYCGSYDQSPDPYLQSAIFTDGGDDKVPAYNGVAHMVFRKCYMGNSTSINPIYVEGSCFPDTLGLANVGTGINIMPNRLDMNPVGILHHIFTDDWGSLGIDPTKINAAQWKEVAQTLFNEGNGSSLIVANAAQASDAVKELLSQMGATIFQDPSTGMYDLILVRFDYDVDTLPELGPADVTQVQNFTKVLWSETINTVRIKFTDRTQAYKDDVTAQAQDFGNITVQGKVKPNEITMQSIYDPIVANMIAWRELSNQNIPLYSTTLVMNRVLSFLRPGSVFKYSNPEYGIVSMILRVRKFGLGTLADGSITMDVVQDQFSAANVLMAPPAATPYVRPDTSAKPIVAPYLYELPYWIDRNAQLGTPDGYQTIGVFAKQPGAYSVAFNGYDVGVPEDGEILDTAPYATYGTIANDLGQFDGWESGVLPTLHLASFSAAPKLLNSNEAGVRSGVNLFVLNGEIMAYETFTDNGDGTYVLNNVHRALLDTTYIAGKAGDTLYLFEGQNGVFDGNFPIGTENDFYFTDKTSSDQYAAANAAKIAVTPAGRLALPLPPDGVTIAAGRAVGAEAGAGDTIALAWAARSRTASPAAIQLEEDAADAPEPGTVYKVSVTKASDGSELFSADDIDAPNYALAITDAMQGNVIVNVFGKLNGKLSYTPAISPLYVAGELAIDGNRVTIDGNGITI